MTKELTLHPYQGEDTQDVFSLVLNGEPECKLCLPTGRGKTVIINTVLEKLRLAKRSFRGAVIVAPQKQIEGGFWDDIDVTIPHDDPEDCAPLPAKFTIRKSTRLRLREGRNAKKAFQEHLKTPNQDHPIALTTHQAVTRWFKDGISLSNLKGMILVVDEAHHSEEKNNLGAFISEWEKNEGQTIFVTATPFRNNGELFFSFDIPGPIRTTAELSKDGKYAPEYLKIESVELKGYVANTNQELMGETISEEAQTGNPFKNIVDLWIKDGRPKALVILPGMPKGQGGSEKYAENLIQEFINQGVKTSRIVNAVGAGNDVSRDLEKRLTLERGVTSFKGSTVDVIVAAARFNEGTDWPLCSNIYNVGLTNSFQRMVQRLGRGQRKKLDDHPNKKPHFHQTTTKMTFLVPEITQEKVRERFEDWHHEHGMLLGAFTHDWKTAQEYRAWFRFRPEDVGRKRSGKHLSKAALKQVFDLVKLDDQAQATVLRHITIATVALKDELGSNPTTEQVRVFLLDRKIPDEEMDSVTRTLGLMTKDSKAQELILRKVKALARKTNPQGLSRVLRSDMVDLFHEALNGILGQVEVDSKIAEGILEMASKFKHVTARDFSEELRVRLSEEQQPWAEEEVLALQVHYPSLGAEGCMIYLPGRTASAIKGRAFLLGIHRETNLEWVLRKAGADKVEDLGLGTRTDQEIATTFAVPYHRVVSLRNTLGIEACKVTGQSYDVDWDQQGLGTDTDKNIAERIGVDRSTVALVRKKKGIPALKVEKNLPQTPEDWLERFGETTDVEIASRVGLTPNRICSVRNELGLPAVPTQRVCLRCKAGFKALKANKYCSETCERANRLERRQEGRKTAACVDCRIAINSESQRCRDCSGRGPYWTEEERLDLDRRVEAGETPEQISLGLGRSVRAVQTILQASSK